MGTGEVVSRGGKLSPAGTAEEVGPHIGPVVLERLTPCVFEPLQHLIARSGERRVGVPPRLVGLHQNAIRFCGVII